VLNSYGATHVINYSIIPPKYSSTIWTENNCASGNLSSKFVGSSPLFNHDR
jgi:hypothetical protein